LPRAPSTGFAGPLVSDHLFDTRSNPNNNDERDNERFSAVVPTATMYDMFARVGFRPLNGAAGPVLVKRKSIGTSTPAARAPVLETAVLTVSNCFRIRVDQE
jgi:hypothetical protein